MSRLSHRHLLVLLRRVDPHPLTPDDQWNRHQKNQETEGSRDKGNVLNAHCLCPGGKREKDDDREHVPHEDNANHGVTENLQTFSQYSRRIWATWLGFLTS